MCSPLAFAVPGCAPRCVSTPGPANTQRRLLTSRPWFPPTGRRHNFAVTTVSAPPVQPPGPRCPGGSDRGRPGDDGADNCGDDNSGFSLLALWRAYNQALKHAPIQTKAATAGVLNLIADLMAQLIGMRGELGRLSFLSGLDTARFLRFGIFGCFFAGPLGHYWYSVLDGIVRYSGPGSVVAKTALDQLCFCPFVLALFFGVIPLLEGKSVNDARKAVCKNLKSTVFTSWKIWPLLNIVNFGVVPAPMRVLFVNGMSVFWVTFLSLVSSA